jgi:hypothetical protein
MRTEAIISDMARAEVARAMSEKVVCYALDAWQTAIQATKVPDGSPGALVAFDAAVSAASNLAKAAQKAAIETTFVALTATDAVSVRLAREAQRAASAACCASRAALRHARKAIRALRACDVEAADDAARVAVSAAWRARNNARFAEFRLSQISRLA